MGDCLFLDHFYIGVPLDGFQHLLKLPEVLGACEHIQVKSDDDQWEGIYLFSQSGPYFELLKERRSDGLGIAFRSQVEMKEIMSQWPEFSWKSGVRTQANGEPWFDWLSLGDYQDEERTWFNAWIMHYDPSVKARKIESHSIKRFLSLELALGRDRVAAVKEMASWFPEPLKLSDEDLEIHVPDKFGQDFRIKIKLVEGDQLFSFDSLKMELVKGHRIPALVNLGVMSLQVDGDEAVLGERILLDQP